MFRELENNQQAVATVVTQDGGALRYASSKLNFNKQVV